MSETVFSINYDEYGKLVNATMNGRVGERDCDPPDGEPEVIQSYGSNPEEGDGIQFLSYPGGRWCIRIFNVLICF